jgi:ribonuclease P protein component
VAVTFLPADDGYPRVAFAVGRRVGGAVERNRLRRRLRAIVSEAAPGLRPGAYLVAAGPDAASLPHPELQAAVIDALEVAAR